MENGKMTDQSVITKSMSEEFPEKNSLSDKTTADFLSVEVSRKCMRTVRMRMEKAGLVQISAPYRFTDKAIMDFIRENGDWIYHNQKTLSNVVSIRTLSFISGETVYYKGNPMILTIVPDRTNSLVVGESSMILCIHPKSSHKERMAFFKSQMKYRLFRILTDRIAFWENQMDLHCNGFCIKDLKSRWGSCDITTGKLTFNLYLIEASLECMDYVIVHELSHLLYPNHDRGFWNLVRTHIPEYKRISQELDRADRNQKISPAIPENTSNLWNKTGA